MNSPAWLSTAVFYQIYPQSYLDTNNDGIGDLPGIIAKLDYIQSLGVNALWLNPVFDSPFGDAGYDVRDFKKVAPRYGSTSTTVMPTRIPTAPGSNRRKPRDPAPCAPN